MRGPSAPIWRDGSIVDQARGASEFGIETVLVVHAHPGDEVFATRAATLAAKAAGHRVVLRLLTGGEGRTARLTSQGLRDTRRAALRLRRDPRPLGNRAERGRCGCLVADETLAPD
jgi:hypothetical protein